MTIRPVPGSSHPGSPRPGRNLVHQSALERLALEEPAAFRHEHGRLYNALEHAAQIAELADHDDMARILRAARREVAAELAADQEHRP